MTHYCDYCQSSSDRHGLIRRSQDGDSAIVICYFCGREIGHAQWLRFSRQPAHITYTHATSFESPPDAGQSADITTDDIRLAIELLGQLVDVYKHSVYSTAKTKEVYIAPEAVLVADALQNVLRGGLPGGLKERDA